MITTIWTRPDGTKFRADPRRMSTYSNCHIEYREPTPDEIKELRIPTVVVSILIPQTAIFKSKSLSDKLSLMIKFYDWLERFTKDWVIHIWNVDINDIAQYVSAEEYKEWKENWVEFPPEVDALFTDKPKNEKPTA